MDHIWRALDAWADKLGLVADDETSRRLDAIDRDIKRGDDNVTEFTRLRNQQDFLGASKAVAA